MNHFCPITYEPLLDNQKYSAKGLKLLSPQLTKLNDLNYSAQEIRTEGLLRADKMSIQGIQSKVSATLDLKESAFKIVDLGGRYILKPQSQDYEQLPENEDLTMRMAKVLGIEVPIHGLVQSKDGSWTYFIKRFDRIGRNKKLAVEDFSQLTGQDRETKYQYSMEKLVEVIDRYTTFPVLEKAELFLRVLFNFLIGNEDMHLKNYSLITRNNKTTLAPAYDFLNTTIALRTKEEIALPLNGKKSNLRKKDFFEYYASERLRLNNHVIDDAKKRIQQAINDWFILIERSFLSDLLKEKYREMLQRKLDVLALN
jgi:serine/threonine-protein kinase HipA